MKRANATWILGSSAWIYNFQRGYLAVPIEHQRAPGNLFERCCSRPSNKHAIPWVDRCPDRSFKFNFKILHLNSVVRFQVYIWTTLLGSKQLIIAAIISNISHQTCLIPHYCFISSRLYRLSFKSLSSQLSPYLYHCFIFFHFHYEALRSRSYCDSLGSF